MIFTYLDLELQIEGSFTKGSYGDYDNEPEPDNYEVYSICTGDDQDITHLFTSDQLDELELLILETL